MFQHNRRPHHKRPQQNPDEPVTRVRTPRDKEVLGILEQRLGASRMRVRCLDGKIRLCRIPGRMKRKLWVRENDVVLVEPWEMGGDERGDIIFKYRQNEVAWLEKRGLFKRVADQKEF